MEFITLRNNAGEPVAKLQKREDGQLVLFSATSDKYDLLPTCLQHGFNKIVEGKDTIEFITYNVDKQELFGHHTQLFTRVMGNVFEEKYTTYTSYEKVTVDTSKERT